MPIGLRPGGNPHGGVPLAARTRGLTGCGACGRWKFQAWQLLCVRRRYSEVWKIIEAICSCRASRDQHSPRRRKRRASCTRHSLHIALQQAHDLLHDPGRRASATFRSSVMKCFSPLLRFVRYKAASASQQCKKLCLAWTLVQHIDLFMLTRIAVV